VAKLLEASKVAKLRSQELTYDEVDRPAAVPPIGYAHFSRTHQIAASADFRVAGRALMTWQVQARSGLRIFASSLEVEPGGGGHHAARCRRSGVEHSVPRRRRH